MTIDEDDWIEVFKRDNGCCQYCDVDLLSSFSSFQSSTVDHIIARSSGGTDDTENLVLSCPACNQMLSRAGHLTTYGERKAYLTERIKNKAEIWYNPLIAELRSGNVK